MSDARICPCGGMLLSRRDCAQSDDEVLRHVGEAYLDHESGYCLEEDDVVPFAWAFRTEAERQQRIEQQRINAITDPFGGW